VCVTFVASRSARSLPHPACSGDARRGAVTPSPSCSRAGSVEPPCNGVTVHTFGILYLEFSLVQPYHLLMATLLGFLYPPPHL
jgi:hypothetical protein